MNKIVRLDVKQADEVSWSGVMYIKSILGSEPVVLPIAVNGEPRFNKASELWEIESVAIGAICVDVDDLIRELGKTEWQYCNNELNDILTDGNEPEYSKEDNELHAADQWLDAEKHGDHN